MEGPNISLDVVYIIDLVMRASISIGPLFCVWSLSYLSFTKILFSRVVLLELSRLQIRGSNMFLFYGYKNVYAISF